MRIEGSDIICETRDEQGVVTDRIRYMKKNVSGQTIFDSQDYFDKVYQSDKGGYYRIDLTSGTKEEIPYWILVDLGLISETATNTAYDNKGNAITYNLNNRIGSGYSFGKLTTWGVDDELVIYAINPQYIVCKEDSTLVYIDTNNGSVVKTLDVSLPTLNGIAYSKTLDNQALDAVQTYFDPNIIALGGIINNDSAGVDSNHVYNAKTGKWEYKDSWAAGVESVHENTIRSWLGANQGEDGKRDGQANANGMVMGSDSTMNAHSIYTPNKHVTVFLTKPGEGHITISGSVVTFYNKYNKKEGTIDLLEVVWNHKFAGDFTFSHRGFVFTMQLHTDNCLINPAQVMQSNNGKLNWVRGHAKTDTSYSGGGKEYYFEYVNHKWKLK